VSVYLWSCKHLVSRFTVEDELGVVPTVFEYCYCEWQCLRNNGNALDTVHSNRVRASKYGPNNNTKQTLTPPHSSHADACA
jgi:hypothetical protein